MGPPTVEQPNNTYSLAHTRPTLLKQLDNVKVRIIRKGLLLFIKTHFWHLKRLQATLGENLPDKGENLAKLEQQIINRITSIKGGDVTLMEHNKNKENVNVSNMINWCSTVPCFLHC